MTFHSIPINLPKVPNLREVQVDGVVLAAGQSRRAGVFKMALEIGEKTVIERTIEGMYEICDRIIVVGGFKIEIVREILDTCEKVEVVFNENYEAGMFTSVKTGISHVSAQKFFLTPGDYPLIGENVYRKMLGMDGDIIIPTFNSRKGHPVLMRSHLIDKILANPDSYNLRDFIVSEGFTTIEVDDDVILMDIDTM